MNDLLDDLDVILFIIIKLRFGLVDKFNEEILEFFYLIFSELQEIIFDDIEIFLDLDQLLL